MDKFNEFYSRYMDRLVDWYSQYSERVKTWYGGLPFFGSRVTLEASLKIRLHSENE